MPVVREARWLSADIWLGVEPWFRIVYQDMHSKKRDQHSDTHVQKLLTTMFTNLLHELEIIIVYCYKLELSDNHAFCKPTLVFLRFRQLLK